MQIVYDILHEHNIRDDRHLRFNWSDKSRTEHKIQSNTRKKHVEAILFLKIVYVDHFQFNIVKWK